MKECEKSSLIKPLPLLIFGSEGASKEAFTLIKHINASKNMGDEGNSQFNVLGFVDADSKLIGRPIIENTTIITWDGEFHKFIANFDRIGIVLPFGSPALKAKILRKIIESCEKAQRNLVFPNLVHPSVVLDFDTTEMGKGNLIFPGVTIAPMVTMGDFNSINRNATIGHDVKIGDFNTIYPGAVVSGCINMENYCSIGAGAVILQGLSIAEGATVGAGAVVTKPVNAGNTVVGIPARIMNR